MRTIARDSFQMTVAAPDVSGVMKALSDVRVTVYTRDTTNTVKIYRNHDGTTQGPTSESGATGGPNPFTTGASGMIEFWCDGPAELDVLIEDTLTPPNNRIATRTVGWNCMPVAVGSIPTSMLSADQALDLDALSAEVLRQMHQIGEVIDWWRPHSSVPLPSGFEICDGRQIPAGQHDFPGLSAAAINLPDLRNTFILGALPATAGEAGLDSGGAQRPFKAFAAGAGQGDTAGDAPGVGGSGGSNAAKNFQHKHNVTVANHIHSAGTLVTAGHTHTVSVSGQTGATGFAPIARTPADSGTVAPYAHTHPFSGSGGTSDPGSLGMYGSTGSAGGATVESTDPAWVANPGTDVRPRFVGLLKLMKVRRN